MGNPPQPQVITARILIEPGTESIERTRNYVIQALKLACKNIRDGHVFIGFYDEDNQLIGYDGTGVASEDFQNLVDGWLESFEGRHMS